MVIHYTDEDVKELFDSDEFNNNLLAYKKDNSKKISELSSFFNSLDINLLILVKSLIFSSDK